MTIKFFKGAAFSVQAPNFVVLDVTNTEPGFKGDTATSGTKPATVETGAVIQVPLFVNEGDKIRILRSDQVIKIMKLSEVSFLDILHRKMRM